MSDLYPGVGSAGLARHQGVPVWARLDCTRVPLTHDLASPGNLAVYAAIGFVAENTAGSLAGHIAERGHLATDISLITNGGGALPLDPLAGDERAPATINGALRSVLAQRIARTERCHRAHVVIVAAVEVAELVWCAGKRARASRRALAESRW